MSKEPPPAGSQAEEPLLAPVVLTAAQAAQMLQVSAQLIVRWARDGVMCASIIGRRRLF